MAFTRRMKGVFITAVFYIGAGGAVFTSASKRTGRITITRYFSKLGPNKTVFLSASDRGMSEACCI